MLQGCLPSSNTFPYRSSEGVLANENTGFTEDQVRDAVKRQLAIAQAEANEAHSAQIAPGAEDGWDGA